MIGVNRVADAWLPPLISPEIDANALAESLRNTSGAAIPRAQVTCAVGSNATRANLVRTLHSIVTSLTVEDSLLVYFAGHGLVEGDDLFLCCADAAHGALSETAVSGRELDKILSSVQCRGVLVILDCCHGGAFVEVAPQFFRAAGKSEYRILLASARADQRSWERADGKGTLFSRALIDIVSGRTPVGTNSGAIYFSDLVKGIDDEVNEALERVNKDASQDMALVGTYARDPLILLNRSLSLQTLSYAMARYSPRHVRWLLTRYAILLTGTAFFLLTVAYGFLNGTQYADRDQDYLVVLQGYPGLNLPGYPKRLWELGWKTTWLASDHGDPLPIVAPLGKSVIPLVFAGFAPDMRAAQLLYQGDRASARALAISTMDDGARTNEERKDASMVFADAAESGDVARLVQLLADVRQEVRLSAMRALLRLDSEQALAARQNSQLLAADHWLDEDILRQLNGPCTEQIRHYLSTVIDSESNIPTNNLILDAALRSGCVLSEDALIRALLRPNVIGAEGLVSYAKLMRNVDGFARTLVERLPSAPNLASRARVADAIAVIDDAPCIDAFRPFAQRAPDHFRYSFIAALAAHCPGERLSAKRLSGENEFEFTLEYDGKAVTRVAISASHDAFVLRAAGRYFTKHDGATAVAIYRALLSAVDDDLKMVAIEGLIANGSTEPLPLGLLDSNNLGVRRALYEYERARDPAKMKKDLMARLGAADEFYLELLGRMPMSSDDMTFLKAKLGASDSQRTHAACVVAMQGGVADALSLLTSPIRAIRESASKCAPFNDNAGQLMAQIPENIGGFPVESHAFLQGQIARKTDLMKFLAEHEDQRLERLDLLDLTPAGFGAIGFGLRVWVEEARFQARQQLRTNKTS